MTIQYLQIFLETWFPSLAASKVGIYIGVKYSRNALSNKPLLPFEFAKLQFPNSPVNFDLAKYDLG